MKIAMLLSGGVDSSVALHLLRQDDKYEITVFYLKIWLEEELSFLGDCPWETDLKYARDVCEMVKVPLEVLPFQTEYQETIVEYTLNELKSGRTPSPDILCNQYIKFGKFFRQIDPQYNKIATGHYAQLIDDGKNIKLKCSPDPVKDQTYFLSSLNQDQLSRAIFPIGHLYKQDVRKLAEELNLPNKTRKDSQGLCFLGKIKYNDFVKFHLGEKPGDIIEKKSGKILGKHKGYWYHTIGQRQGLCLSGGPWYVVNKDIVKNIVYVSHQDNYNAEAVKEFTVSDVHWISGKPQKPMLKMKLRHGPQFLDCEIQELNDNRLNIVIANPDTGVASGQSAIFYDAQICLGRGVIE